MDGIKAKLNSLQFRLALGLSFTMFIAAIAIGVIGFYSTLHDAHGLQDNQLHDIADMVDAGRIAVSQTNVLNPGNLDDPDAHVLVQLIESVNAPGASLISGQIRFPDGLPLGLQTLKIDQLEWRAFVQNWPAGGKLVVAQQTEVRDEIARHAGQKTLWRILAAIPLLLLLLNLMLRQMLAPLSKLAAELNSRHAEDMSAISDQGLPLELLPLIHSTNAVLNRIALVLEQQRRFVADAAHELRSPLTALTLQTKNLSLQDMSGEAHRKLGEFGRGIQRANDLVDQLLTMARVQIKVPLTAPQNEKQVSVQQVLRIVFEEMLPFADDKHIQLGFEQSETVDTVINGAAEMDLVMLVRNLVDNAIRYTPSGGKVEVVIAAADSAVVIEVRDNGPGIALEERARVFDSFYRVLGTGQSGSGLGLSIVKSIVTAMQGEINLNYFDPVLMQGTVVTVKIPQGRR